LTFIDANQPDDGSVFESDICIVGAGAAGIAASIALADKGWSVGVLESGGLEFDRATHELCAGPIIGDAYPWEMARMRFFGGSTNHWGGQCRRLSEIDFEKLPWVADSGWPFAKAELDPYYDRALEIVDIPAGYERVENVVDDIAEYPPLLGPLTDSFAPIVWLKSPPTRMGIKYRRAISASGRIRCYLRANAIELIPDEQGRTIRRLEARTLQGRQLSFRARVFLLCAGSIENARLLLLSSSVDPRGIGNAHDLVGRYFAEHCVQSLKRRMILAAPAGKRGFQEEHLQRRARKAGLPVTHVLFGFAATERLRRRHSLLGFSLGMSRGGKLDPERMEDAVAALLASEPPSAADPREAHGYDVWIMAEQAPNPNNRLYLVQEKDALGLRKTALDWKVTEADRRNMLQGMRLFSRDLARSGNGRVRVPSLDDFEGPFLVGHQMGTTRMSADPRKGVTNPYGRVHDIANLFIAGSSVFPTYGYVNPTLTLLGTTLRTVDHIASLYWRR
jgi:choline dehydrogenase-like flavoprotein